MGTRPKIARRLCAKPVAPAILDVEMGQVTYEIIYHIYHLFWGIHSPATVGVHLFG